MAVDRVLGAKSVKQPMTPHKMVSPPNLARSRRQSLLLALPLTTLISFLAMQLLVTPVAAQGTPGGSRGTQLQTAARARTVSNPATQWSAGSNENAASTQPRVTFENGLLSISANNSSLSDILIAVHSCTGADIDLPNDVSTERVTVQLGPGPARKVLSDLLGWSSYDYIIQGSGTDSLAIQSVTLMVRTKSAAVPITAATQVPNRRPSAPPVATIPEITPPAPTETPEVPSAMEQPASSPDGLGTPLEMHVQPLASAPAVGSSSGKSTSEMIQDLQQMYQQRRMLQEQQSQSPAQKSPPGN